MHLQLLQKGQFRITAEATADLIGDKFNNTITKILFCSNIISIQNESVYHFKRKIDQFAT